MIYGVGIDVEKIENVRKIYEKHDLKFLKKIFCASEIELFKSRNFSMKTICANFCVKEAFSKALGTGFSGISLLDIAVLRDELGKPYVELKEVLHNNLADKMKNEFNIHVSVSHTDEIAEAIVIIEY